MKVFIEIGTEVWKDVTYPGVKNNLYQISDHGRIKNKNWDHILSQQLGSAGYYRLALQTGEEIIKERQFSIHRLVCYEFVKNDDLNKIEVNHKNGIKRNNYYKNLEWSTHGDNIRHAVKMGLHWQYKGEAHFASIYTEKLVKFICKLLVCNESVDKILKLIRLNFTEYDKKSDILLKNFIGKIIRKERWSHITNKYKY